MKRRKGQILGWAIQFGILATASPAWAESAQAPAQMTPVQATLAVNPDPLISMDLRNADVRTVLRYLARRGNLSLVLDDSVKGTLSLDIRNMPLDQVFTVVMKAQDLGYQQIGGALLVAKSAVLAAKHLNDTTATIRLNNASATDLATRIAPMIPKEAKVFADPRTNSVVVEGSDEAIAAVRNILTSLDNPAPQVLLEVKMVEMSETDADNLRVSYGNTTSANGATPAYIGIAPPGPAGQQVSGAFTPDDRGTVINYNPLAPFQTIAFNTQLSWLVTHGKATILANPKVLAQDSAQATINLVNQVPYVTYQITATGQQVPSVNFVNIGQTLTVTPRIDTHGFITMTMTPNITTTGGAPVTIGGGVTIPVVNQRSVSTTLRVQDGQSIVIGGLLRDDKTDSVSEIPFLGEIPILGALFRQTQKSETKNDIVVIVTPHLVK